MKKTTVLLLCSILIFSALAACGGSSSYRTDVPAADIAAAVDAILADGADMAELSDTYITGSMQLSVGDYKDYCVKIASKGVNINEYGIFKGTDGGHAKTIKADLEAYLQMRLDSWMPEYMPEELPKLENAEIKVCGTYVMYAILSDEERAAAFSAFETAVKAS
ncbi:MAG: DUF4358 domain-containing protein [Clostridia bacterium]|nr:DUF4358 domain-containing protein [Clostridia bacterium]